MCSTVHIHIDVCVPVYLRVPVPDGINLKSLCVCVCPFVSSALLSCVVWAQNSVATLRDAYGTLSLRTALTRVGSALRIQRHLVLMIPQAAGCPRGPSKCDYVPIGRHGLAPMDTNHRVLLCIERRRQLYWALATATAKSSYDYFCLDYSPPPRRRHYHATKTACTIAIRHFFAALILGAIQRKRHWLFCQLSKCY